MIHNESEFELNREALQDIEGALASLKERIDLIDPYLFLAMRESYDKSIAEIQTEMDTYLKKKIGGPQC